METLEISNVELYGVPSTGPCLVKRLQRPFASVKEPPNSVPSSHLSHESNDRNSHFADPCSCGCVTPVLEHVL